MEKLTVFADFFSTLGSSISLREIVDIIRGDEQLKSITLAYRSTHDHHIKERCHTFAVAATFEGGKGKQHIRAFTGLSLVDLDHVPREKLAQLLRAVRKDPHTLLCYVTVSGEGLRVLFRYEHDAQASLKEQEKGYANAFLAGNQYYGCLTGQPWDGQCKNTNRLSGMAYDPEAYFNPDAIPFTRDEVREHSAQVREQSKAEKALRNVQNFYDGTIKPKLDKEGVVYKPGNHNQYVMRVGYDLAYKRYNVDTVISWAKATFPEYEDTEQVIRSCFANASKEKSGGKASREPRTATVDDIENYLASHAQLRRNEVLDRIEQLKDGKWIVMDKIEFNNFWREISRNTHANANDVERILSSDFVKPYNPFRAYLEEVASTPDDGVDYIRLMAQTVKVKGGEKEQEFWYECLKKWLVGLVAGWLGDNEVNSVVLVFIGPQGTYKSTWQRNILPPELCQYFSIMLNTGKLSKDDKIRLANKALVCCEELDTMTPSELNQFKAIITTTHIDERAPYAHFSERRKRYASFCGNGNSALLLSDITGNRRWMPFEIVEITSPLDHPFPYRGIYAQAYRLYKSGYRYWLNAAENKRLNQHNKDFEAPKPEQELVSTYFRKPGPGETGQFITTSRALQLIGGNISQKLSLNKIGHAFAELGFERKRHQGTRGFIAVERNAEQIRAYGKSITLGEPEPTDGDDLPF